MTNIILNPRTNCCVFAKINAKKGNGKTIRNPLYLGIGVLRFGKVSNYEQMFSLQFSFWGWNLQSKGVIGYPSHRKPQWHQEGRLYPCATPPHPTWDSSSLGILFSLSKQGKCRLVLNKYKIIDFLYLAPLRGISDWLKFI